MKKVIISAVAALIAGIAISLWFCLTPSKQVYCYTVSQSGTLYTVAEFQNRVFMRAVNKEKGLDKTEPLNDVINADIKQYLDIAYFRDEIYLMSQGVNDNGAFVRVDRFSVDGKWQNEVLSIPLIADTKFFSADFSEVYYEKRENSDALDAVVSVGNTIFTQEIGRNGKAQELRRYILEEGDIPGWVGVSQFGVVYFGKSGLCYIDSDMVQHVLLQDYGNIDSPFMLSNAIYGVSLDDVSLDGYILFYEFGDGTITGSEFIHGLGSATANRELADGIYFSDLRNIQVSDWAGQGEYFYMGIIKHDGERAKIVSFNEFTGNSKVYDEPLLPIQAGAVLMLPVFGVVFVTVFLIMLIGGRLLALRKVVVKQVAISVVIIAAAFGVMLLTSNVFMKRLLDNAEMAALRDTLDYVSGGIDADTLCDEGLSDEMYLLMNEYEDRNEPMFSVENNLSFPNLYSFGSVDFIRVAKRVNDEYYYIYYYGYQEPAALASYYTSEDTLEKISELNPGEYHISTSRSMNRLWMEESCALTDSSGNNVGFVMVGMEYNSLENSVQSAAFRLSVIWSFIFALICASFLLFLIKLLSPLKKIKKAVSEISEGKIGTRVTIKTNDELQDIAASFSEMSVKLEKYFNSINVISKAYERYLPKDFFRLMDKRSVLEVSPEDSRDVMLTYLFIGIDMNRLHSAGADGFSALNRIYGLVSTTVSAFGGAVQSLDDRRMTCIFSGETSSAVEAALMIREKLTAEDMSDAEVKITLQRAESTIGVIGTGEAMKPVTVSSAIEMQQYISAVMKEFDLSYVLTDNVKNALFGVNVTLKYIGNLAELCGLSDERFRIGLYEVPEGCGNDERQLKLSTLSAFNRGMDEFRAGRYHEARSHMIDVLRVNRGDLIARYYLLKCEDRTFLKENKNELRN